MRLFLPRSLSILSFPLQTIENPRGNLLIALFFGHRIRSLPDYMQALQTDLSGIEYSNYWGFA